MTAVQYVENILAQDWEENIEGRYLDVPEPTVVRESEEGDRRMNLQNSDYIVVSDGGISDITPASFGWVEEQTTSRVTLDIRTSYSRERLWGDRYSGDTGDVQIGSTQLGDENTSGRYGGLVGEAKRIIDLHRKGDKEFDLIVPYEANDLSGQMGGKVWRATLSIRLEVRASTIDPQP